MRAFFIISFLWSILLVPFVSAVEIVIAGGVALRSWESNRAPDEVHDRWWANFIRASTLHFALRKHEKPDADILWIVYRPSYLTRQAEDGKPYTTWIAEHAVKYKVRLVWVDSSQEAIRAINNAPRRGKKVTRLTYYGHSNAHAFMLDYSNSLCGASRAWIHENDLGTLIRRDIFAPDAVAYSYGCHTGESMSQKWKAALGIPLWGNTKKTRYQSLMEGKLPEGTGEWRQ